MVAIVNKLAKGELDQQERGVFTEAYRLAIGKLRTASRLMQQIARHKRDRSGGSNKGRCAAEEEALRYKEKIDHEIEGLCRQCLDALNKMSSGSSPQHKAFLAKENADILRYLAEINPNKIDDAARAYEDAKVKADALRTEDPLRLAIFVNYAVFLYEIKRDVNGAIRVAEKALEETESKSDNREETVMRALITKNLQMWRAGDRS